MRKSSSIFLLLWAALLSSVIAGGVSAQVFGTEAPSSSEVLTLPEIRILLLAREVPTELIDRTLESFAEDRVFTSDEAEILIESVVALTAPGSPDLRKEGALSGSMQPPGVVGEKEPVGTRPVPVPFRLESELPLFGQILFRGAPQGFEPAEDLAVGAGYMLGAGDELSIVLWGKVQKNWTPVIERDGTFGLPQVGVVPAAGLSLGELRNVLEARLAAVFTGFRMSVTVKTLRSVQVSVLGEVRRPGTYTLSPLSSSFNALYFAGGPMEVGSLRTIKVFNGDSLQAVVDLYDLLMSGESRGDVRMGTDYRIFVPPVNGLISIRGDVRRPGRYEILPGETVQDGIRFAGGLTATSFAPRAVLERVNSRGERLTMDVNLASEADSVILADGDVLTVYPVFHVQPRRFVHVSGDVQSPGRYQLYPGMTVSDLLFRAGNLLESAYPDSGQISRLVPSEADTVAATWSFDLAQALAAPRSIGDPVLQPEDRLYVRRSPGWQDQSTVDVRGEVRFPGTYTLNRRGERLSELVKRAGGLTPTAFLPAAGLFREGEGRIIVDFERAFSRSGQIEDVALVDGDSVFVARYKETIQVVGEVSRPGGLVYQPNQTADYYLRRTGGYTDDADEGRVKIIQVDGSVRDAKRGLWFDPEVPPGAVIEVGAKSREKGIDWLAVTRDATTIVSGLATTIFIITQINK